MGDEDANGLLSYFGEPDLDKEPEDIITDATVNCRNTGSSKGACEESKQCYWLEKSKFDGKCIHQTERLYNALYKKLHKRGKKDIAIQVFYKSRPAKVKLPHGLYGPHIIGAFNHLHKLRPNHAPIGYNSYLNSYGYGGYNHYGYGKGYGHGYGGYGHGNGGYGHGNGDYGYGKGGYEHGNHGYGHGNGGYDHDGGYGSTYGGYGHGKDGYGGGHGYSDYSGPTYGHQGHSAGYSSGPSYGSKGYGGYE